MEPRPAQSGQNRISYLAAILASIDAPNPHRTAQDVFDHFGSLAAFAGADIAQMHHALQSIPALPPALVAAQSIALAAIRERAITTQLTPHAPAFLDYLRLRLAARETEILLGYFGAADGTFMCERALAESDGGSIAISAVAILRVAITAGAAQVILVHNHPSGLAYPSEADRVATRQIMERAKALDISLIDHLIVGGSRIHSMQRGCLV